jgi:uncharacterized repeat protein (TIGR01451 family)
MKIETAGERAGASRTSAALAAGAMARSRVLVTAFAAVLLAFAAPARAQVAQLDSWALAISTNPPGGNFNVNAGNITVTAGSQRLLVVAAVLEANDDGTVANFNASLDGTPLTALAGSDLISGRETAKLWYLLNAQIPGGAAALVVTGTHTQTVTGLHIYWASFSGVDQAAPVNDSSASYLADNTVTFGSQVDFVASGMTFYATGNGNTGATHNPPAGFTQRLGTNTSGHSSFTADAGVHATAGSYAATTTITFTGGTSNRSAVAVASLRPGPTNTTTVGNGLTAEPGASSACPGSGIADLDNFTLVTSAGTDNITSVTVTLGPAGAFNNVATVSITNDAGTTTYGSLAPVSNTVVVALTTNITATTTETQYRVRITPKTHAAMPAVPGASYATTGTVTAIAASNTLVYNDTTSGTVTIDNASPADPTWGTITPASGQITLNWTNPADADFAEVVILRRAGAAVADMPVEGATYVAGNTIGTATVVYLGSGTSFVDTGLTDGTSYYYEIFARDGCVNYSAGVPTGPHVPMAPLANLAIVKTGPASVYLGDSFSYTLTVSNGGPTAASNVTVTDTLPVETVFQSATPSQGSCSGTTTVTCDLGSIASGGSASITIGVQAMALGTASNTASVAATEPDPDLANNSSTVSTTVMQINTADVSITKSGSPASVAVGANVTYTVTVTNGGPDTADGVTVTDVVPAGMTLVSATSTLGTCSGTLIVTCTPGSMAHAATATITIVATVNAAGTKSNTATVALDTNTTYDPNPTNNSATATTTVTGGTEPVCSIPVSIGPGGTLSGVINTYYPGSASVAAGATSITLGAARSAPGAQVPIAVGDLVLVIQMQDAVINSTNTNNYGGNNGTGAGATAVNAGRYEYVRATNAVPLAGGTLNLQGAGAGSGLLNGYANANATAAKGQERFQVVRVPQYTTATLNGVTAAAWLTNTAAPIGLGTGGILAIDVQGALTLSSGVAASVDGQGFRGGAGRQLFGGAGNDTDWRTLSTINTNGGKGEGNAGTPRWVNTATAPLNTNQPNDGYPNGSMARGAPGNAGGGSTDGNPAANDENSGGGGGSNGGAGGTGGYAWRSYLNNGGVGAAVTPALTQLVLGGGGGAGTRNNNPGLPLASGGAAGGGLMVLRAASLTIGAGAILSADGANAWDDTLNDGGGGGGAGGSVIVTVTSGDMNGLAIRARGGKGGSAWRNFAPGTYNPPPDGGNNRHGPGGGGGGGVVAYTNTSVLPALDVTGGLAGITTTANDNFGAQPGALGQTLFAAPGQIPGVGSASDCAPDPAIALAHTPATVASGGAVTFLATVSNAGPFIATSGTITVTITIDPGLTPTTANGAGWTCGIAGQTVTCTRSDSLAAHQSYAGISIGATAIASGPTLLSDNTATVGGGGDINAANNTATDAVGITAPTLALLRSFQAVRFGDAVFLSWQTSFESRNLGFRLYREVGGVRQPLTPSLIAGSALFVGQREMRSGRSYSWVDGDPRQGDNPVYWLEDIDVDGTRQWTGPAIPNTGGAASRIARSANSALLKGLGQAGARRAHHEPQPGLGIERRAEPKDKGDGNRPTLQWSPPSKPAAKILVQQEGWYRVTRADLIAAGFDPGTDPRTLRLLADGVEEAILVRDGGDGSFDSSDSIEFYGVGLDSPYDDAHVYWLVAGQQLGARIENGPWGSFPAAPESFPFTVERKDRTVFFSALTNNGDAENFFGPVITAEPVLQELTLPHPDFATPGNSSLRVALQGVTVGVSHYVDVQVNGHDVGAVVFSGQEHAVEGFKVPNAWLYEGSNQVTLVARGGDEDVSVIDFIQLTYPHFYQLDSGALRMTAAPDTRVTIQGLADTSLRVIDVTDRAQPRELAVRFLREGLRQWADVSVFGPKFATLFAFTAARVSSPAGMVPNIPSRLRARQNGADLVIVAHPSLLASMKPLQALRQSQGLVTQVVDVTDVYDEFAFGQKTPFAVRDFLLHAQQAWWRQPRYALLVGDASFDPKEYLGLGNFDLLPTKLVPTAYMKTDSDDWLVDFDGDGLPELPIGRLPARTPAEVSTMVSKILAREAALAQHPEWARSVLLVADQNDEFDFEAATAGLRSLLPRGFRGPQVLIGQLGGASRDAIVSSVNAGQLLVSYTGHGSEDVWSRSAVFNGDDAAALTNGAKLPVFVAMTCLNGLFDDLYVESLAEALLKAPAGGAAAVWASSGLTEPGPQAAMSHEFFRWVFQGGPITLGDAITRAKAAVADPDTRRTWILFGDPTMRVH